MPLLNNSFTRQKSDVFWKQKKKKIDMQALILE